jgi:hypothetical protein
VDRPWRRKKLKTMCKCVTLIKLRYTGDKAKNSFYMVLFITPLTTMEAAWEKSADSSQAEGKRGKKRSKELAVAKGDNCPACF